jgi:hypothetical protein
MTSTTFADASGTTSSRMTTYVSCSYATRPLRATALDRVCTMPAPEDSIVRVSQFYNFAIATNADNQVIANGCDADHHYPFR